MPTAIRKPLVAMVGGVILIASIAMVVLPGPGAPVSFLGLAILATEFAIAARVRDWAMHTTKKNLRRLRSKLSRPADGDREPD